MSDSKISYWMVPPEVAELDTPLLEKSILGVVFSFTRNGGECWATDKQFATAFGCGERTVERAMSRLYILGWLGRTVERKPNGVTPRRLFLTLPYRQIDATPPEATTPYRQIDATLPSNCPDPTVKLTLPYRHSDAQIVINKNKKEVIESTAPANASAPSSPLKNLLTTESVIKESFTTDERDHPSLEKPESPSTQEEAARITIPPQHAAPPLPKKSPALLDEMGLPAEIRASAERWIEHRRLTGKPVSSKKLAADVKKFGVEFPKVVEESIVQGWQGLFPLKKTKLRPWQIAERDTTELFTVIDDEEAVSQFVERNPVLLACVKQYRKALNLDGATFLEKLSDTTFRSIAITKVQRIYQTKLEETK